MSALFGRTYFLLALLASLTFSKKVNAQTVDSLALDTLISVLTLQEDNERMANAYLGLSDLYVDAHEYEIGMTYAKLAKDLSADINYNRGELDAAKRMAHINLAYYLNYEKALEHYDEALEMAQDLDAEEDLVSIYRGYMNLYASVENYDAALKFNEKAIDLANNLGMQQEVSDLNAYGGDIYEELGDSTKAMEMFAEVVRIEKENNFMRTSNAALIIVGHYYHMNGELDKSLKHYRSAITKFERLGDMRWVSYTHAEMALLLIEMDDHARAEKHALKGLEIAKEFDLLKEKMDNFQALVKVYNAMGRPNESKIYEDQYNALVDSLQVDVIEREVEEFSDKTPNPEGEMSPIYSAILQAVVLVILIAVVVFLSGIQFRKKR